MSITVDSRELNRRFKELIKNTNDSLALRQLGFFVIKTIRHRTRKLGKGVARPGGARRTLKPVSLEWAIRRSKLARSPEAASGRKSNLTFKGTMLNSIEILKASKGDLVIGFNDSKEEAKAEANTDRGRAFMFLGKVEARDAAAFFKEKVLRNV